MYTQKNGRNSKRRARVIKQPTTTQGNRRDAVRKNYDEKLLKINFNTITNGNTSNSFGQKK
jgi:hypothetical protein